MSQVTRLGVMGIPQLNDGLLAIQLLPFRSDVTLNSDATLAQTLNGNDTVTPTLNSDATLSQNLHANE